VVAPASIRRNRRRRSRDTDTFDVQKFKKLWADPERLKEILRETDPD
jgi:hypothetical protein